jgi:cell division protein FtsI (penicillin-binding protein 3)
MSVFVVAGLAFVALLGRVAVLQLVESEAYAGYGDKQRLRSTSLPAARGAIFDRNGFELAVSGPRTTLWADPRLVQDPAGTAAVIGQRLALSPRALLTLEERLSSGGEFVYVARQVENQTAKDLLALELPGIAGYSEPTRYYPNGSLASGLLGHTDPDGMGTAGLELRYDSSLTGTPGELIRERGDDGETIPTGRHKLVAPEPGTDLVLTLDKPLQYQVEQLLLRTVGDIGARGGMVIVMDTETGDLLALANVRVDEESGDPEVTNANLAVVETYEPGSVAKIVTAAAALNEGVATPQTAFTVPYQKQFYDVVFTDGIPHGNEAWTLTDIITKSSNIGTMMASELVGFRGMDHYLRSFGFGERTALDLPGESAGLLKPVDDWEGTEKVTVSYGYGVAVTAVQLAAAMNVIANGGTYVSPRLVSSTIDEIGREVPAPASATRQVLRPEVAGQMNSILQDVVCSGTATRAQIDGYSVAGKTGTAFKSRGGGYTDSSGARKYYASFAGFLPAEDPQLTVLVSIDEPPAQGDHYGGLVAAPLFVDVAKEAVQRMQIPPTSASPSCPDAG